MLAPWKKSYGKPRQHTKKQRHHFSNQGPCSPSHSFSSGHIQMWELDHLEGCCFSVSKLCPTLCNAMDCSMPGRPPCPSLSPRVCSNSCPLSWWGDPTISSSVAPFSSCPQYFPAQDLFQWVCPSHQMAQVLQLCLQHQSFQWIFRVDFLRDWLVWPPCCSRDSQESFPVPQFESINFLAFFMVQLSHPYMTTEKTITLTYRSWLAKWYLCFLICCLGLS